ncbi:MAG TPA: NADH-quinone oxidoreductase subunit I [Limnochordales bacterium]
MFRSLRDFFSLIRTTLIGMGITIRHMFRPVITINYPEEKPDVPLGYRGIPVLLSDEEGNLKCVSCELCAKACPVNCIEIQSHRDNQTRKKVLDVYNLDSTWCMYCGLCVEACPFDALAMSDQFELASYDLPGLVYTRDQLAEIGRRAITPTSNIRETQNFGIKTGGARR